MSALPSLSPEEQAARYERHISENWNSLSAFEQEQARAYMQSKFQASQPTPVQPVYQSAPGFPQQQFGMASGPQGYGSSYGDPFYGGYGPGAFGPPKVEPGGGWAIWTGYIGLLIFTPIAFFCGIYLLTKGRTGHGIAQVLLSVGFFVLGMMLLTAAG